MSLKTILHILSFIMIIPSALSSNTIKCTNILRNIIIFDNKMPSIYLGNNLNIDDSIRGSVYSMEHIFPRSHMNNKHSNDLHNVIRTMNTLNVNRSNYAYTDILDDDKNWIKLNYDNFVNHKRKLFIPNKSSRGFISRAILYMCKEYEYKPAKIIDNEILLRWFFENPPTKCEKYHNDIIRKMQNTNNIFIANYNKKRRDLIKIINSLY